MKGQNLGEIVRGALALIEQQLRGVGIDVDSAVRYDVEEPQPRVGRELRKRGLIMRWYATERMTQAVLNVETDPAVYGLHYCAVSFTVVTDDPASGLWDRITSEYHGGETCPALDRLCGGMEKWSGQSSEESEALSWVTTLGRGFRAHR